MKKLLSIIITIIVLAGIAIGIYYWFLSKQTNDVVVGVDGKVIPSSGFSTFGDVLNTNKQDQVIDQPKDDEIRDEEENKVDDVFVLPKLRKLSLNPVAMVSASSTASSSIARFMDRGTGHIYEASNTSRDIIKISNTTLPKIYTGFGNKNGTAFVLRYLKSDTDNITNFYAELRSTGTSTTETPFEIKGKYLSPDINQIAVSPNKDRVFTWNIENGKGIGYISSFDERNKTKVIDSPLNQVVIDWPENNTLILSTKASGFSSSFIYSIDTRTGIMKAIIGGIRGLTGKMNSDLTKLLYSTGGTDSLSTYILNTKDKKSENVIFKTISEKCTWSQLRKNEVYCAVPTEIPDGLYPDDWYKGRISFVDQIWHLDTVTGEVHLLANPLTLGDALVDAVELTLDPKEDTLYFINKRDLSLWALDLNQ